MRPKKSLGQHFLNSRDIAQHIVSAVTPTNTIIEVGPGQRILTDFLIKSCERLVLVEKDDQLAADLLKHFKGDTGVEVVHADFLDVNFNDIVGTEEFAIVGNFPYNISSQIVFKMLEHKHQIPELVGMFQREMAQRILAGPGSKTYSVIGVLTQPFYSGSMILEVPPQHFNPPPKVHSAVIRLQRRINLQLSCDEKIFRSVVKAAFGQRRKMLRNSLKGLLSNDLMRDDDLFLKRPEQVSLETFYALARLAQSHRNSQND